MGNKLLEIKLTICEHQSVVPNIRKTSGVQALVFSTVNVLSNKESG